jgi:transposase-like protein
MCKNKLNRDKKMQVLAIKKVRCPNCKHEMNYQARITTKNKRKTCVYCGKSFKVY